MRRLELAVVLYQLVEGDGMIVIQVHACIQYMFPALNQWPEIRRSISVNMAVDHIGPVRHVSMSATDSDRVSTRVRHLKFPGNDPR